MIDHNQDMSSDRLSYLILRDLQVPVDWEERLSFLFGKTCWLFRLGRKRPIWKKNQEQCCKTTYAEQKLSPKEEEEEEKSARECCWEQSHILIFFPIKNACHLLIRRENGILRKYNYRRYLPSFLIFFVRMIFFSPSRDGWWTFSSVR